MILRGQKRNVYQKLGYADGFFVKEYFDVCKLPINILLIDNNPENCREVKRVLSENAQPTEFRVKSVGTLSEAVEALAASGFDIILLDVHLPDSNGVETFDKIRVLA